jgi:hypothetical protein
MPAPAAATGAKTNPPYLNLPQLLPLPASLHYLTGFFLKFVRLTLPFLP